MPCRCSWPCGRSGCWASTPVWRSLPVPVGCPPSSMGCWTSCGSGKARVTEWGRGPAPSPAARRDPPLLPAEESEVRLLAQRVHAHPLTRTLHRPLVFPGALQEGQQLTERREVLLAEPLAFLQDPVIEVAREQLAPIERHGLGE